MLAGPFLAHSHSQLSHASTSDVEDSEPEREQRRSQEKSRRKKKRLEAPIPPLAEVIELTDSDASYHASALQIGSPTRGTKPVVVIDISVMLMSYAQIIESHRTKSNFSLFQMWTPMRRTATDDSLPSIREVLNLPRRVPSASTVPKNTKPQSPSKSSVHKEPSLPRIVIPTSPSAASEGSQDDGATALKLGRFAYEAPNPSRRTLSKTPSPTEGGSIPPEARTTSQTKRLPSHRFARDFSDAELGRILKCVSCDLAWTARKTVTQKMKHIQTCAKKKGLNDDTVRTLLRQELDALPPVASSSKSGTPAPQTDAVPETLLEDVLKDTTRKKPGRRPQVQQTVKSVTETRGDILDRARSLLQGEGVSRASSSVPTDRGGVGSGMNLAPPPATQAFSRSTVGARDDFLAVHAADTTQVFGPSRLADQSSRLQGAIVRAGAEIAAHSEVSPLTQAPGGSGGLEANADEDAPPATQVFARSKLTNATSAVRRIVTSTVGLPDDPISIHDTSEDDLARSSPARPASPATHSSPSSSANSPRRSTSPRAAETATAPSGPSPRRRRSPSPPAGEPSEPAPVLPPPVVDEYNVQWDEWIHEDVWNEDDGACLHYVPDAEVQMPTQTPGAGPSGLQMQAPSAAAGPSQRLATIFEDLARPPDPESSVAAPDLQPPAKKKRGRRKKVVEDVDEGDIADAGAAVKLPEISQEELNAKMKEAILADEALHLRILRYEPIHFDVFVQMAVDLGVPPKPQGALKTKVRAFLDQKAIHFYGADPSKSRTKRTRHP
ncbi:hypothetical protein C8Q77DRAFT_1153914 [Trametes polyzona]|nr:hypothetical protein C8Q77DRAFT_1153914 [Trametes polyzona]